MSVRPLAIADVVARVLGALAIAASAALLIAAQVPAQTPAQAGPRPPSIGEPWVAQDRAIAARFAPVFHQGIVGSGRFDYPTNVDFDGDWIGTNNWANAADRKFPLKAYIYYAVSETTTHYFIHYAVFHPRDTKGGDALGATLSRGVRAGAAAANSVKKTGVGNDVVLAHENDFEGCLVVAEKRGRSFATAVSVIVETMAHNHYLKFAREPDLDKDIGPFRRDGERPILYIEPRGHGIEALDEESEKPAAARDAESREPGRLRQGLGGLMKGLRKLRKVVPLDPPEMVKIYRFTGQADDPENPAPGPGLSTRTTAASATGTMASPATPPAVGYELLPIYSTIWPRARAGLGDTFGEVVDYGSRTISVLPVVGGRPTERRVAIGEIGSALKGNHGAANRARPPWAWFDMSERDRPFGEWFFDPAGTIKRHFSSMSTVSLDYLRLPFMGVR